MTDRPRWNVQHERQAEAWAKRVDSETLAAMLSSGTSGSTYWQAAKAEWNRREANELEPKLLYTIGNLGQGFAWGVEAERQFDVTEIHGPFTTENQANTYAHALVEALPRPVTGPYKGVKVIRLETPQAGRRIVLNAAGTYEYSV